VVKLQKVVNRREKGVLYHKWQVTLPPADVAALGWDHGDELVVERDAKEPALKLRRQNAPGTEKASARKVPKAKSTK
jgi:bifunctional DNA-binding transcriptional regulator/antitoxin component of YhaV-PrlF toxin-antitoxin module